MGNPELDKRIVGSMGPQGWNHDSDVGQSSAGVKNRKNFDSDMQPSMVNPKNLDPNMAKPSTQNPGVDKSFWNKGNAQMDTTGHGKLTRGCED
jgi:hypothetical protein